MKTRSVKAEIMDLGPEYYTQAEYDDALKKLGIISRFLGAENATFKAFNTLNKIDSILEIGCGGGYFAWRLANKFLKTKILGIDINPKAIAHALQNVAPKDESAINFLHHESTQLSFANKSFDAVTATLVCHHLDNEQLKDFFSEAKRVARKAIIINDLHRHWLAWLSYMLIAPFFFNRLIFFDGLLSIKRGFRREELEKILETAGFEKNQYQITWRWPFRWIMEVHI